MSIKVTIPLSQTSDDLLSGYGPGVKLHIERSATQAGTYTEVGTGTAIVSGQETYEVWDPSGTDSSWYHSQVCDSLGSTCSSFSAAFQVGTTGYASLEQFKSFVRDSADATADDNIMLLALGAAKGAIDRYCSRTFDIATGTQTARYFSSVGATRYGGWRGLLRIDDTFDAATTVSLDSTGDGSYTQPITAFRLGPQNAPSAGRPYYELVLNSGVATYPVAVTSDWGWASIPSNVTYAQLIQASRFLKRRDSPFGVAGSPEMGNELRLLARLDPDVDVLLAEYQVFAV